MFGYRVSFSVGKNGASAFAAFPDASNKNLIIRTESGFRFRCPLASIRFFLFGGNFRKMAARRHAQLLKIAALCLLLGVVLTRSVSASSEPPTDLWSNSPLVTAPYSVTSVDVTGAGTDTSDPVPSCRNSAVNKTVWFRFTPPTDGTVVANTFNSNYNTVLSAYTGTPATPFVPVADPNACNEQAPGHIGAGSSQVYFHVTAQVTYSFMISTPNNSGGSLSVSANIYLIPANDSFANAIVINPAVVSFTDTGSNFEAMPFDANDPPTIAPCTINDNSKSVWYQFTPAANGTITVDTLGSSYDTILAAYTGGIGSFSQVACNDDAPNTGTLQSRISFNGTVGTRYSFMVAGVGGDVGTLTFHLTGPPKKRRGQTLSQ